MEPDWAGSDWGTTIVADLGEVSGNADVAMLGGPTAPRVSRRVVLVPLVTERATNRHLVRGEHGANRRQKSAAD